METLTVPGGRLVPAAFSHKASISKDSKFPAGKTQGGSVDVVLASHNTGGVQLAALVVMLIVFGLGMAFIWRADQPSASEEDGTG